MARIRSNNKAGKEQIDMQMKLGNLAAADGFFAPAGQSPIRLERAIFSKVRPDEGWRATAGLPMGFVEMPRDFGPEFEWAATPERETHISAGLTTIDGKEAAGAGAWNVRQGQDHVYLCNTRHARPSLSDSYALGYSATEQSVFAEQLTWRFRREDWAHHAAALFEYCFAWSEAWIKAWATGTDLPDSEKEIWLDADPFDTGSASSILTGLSMDASEPTIVLTTADLTRRSNLHPLHALVSELTPKQLSTATMGYGWRMRLREVSVQLFDEELLSSESGLDALPKLAPLDRYNLHRRCRNGIDEASLNQIAQWVTSDHPQLQSIWSKWYDLAVLQSYTDLYDVSPIPRDELLAMIVILERCYDLAITRKSEKLTVRRHYSGWIAAVVALERDDAQFYDLLSRLEFAPSLLLSQISGAQSELMFWVSARIGQLKTAHPAVHRRLLHRMQVKKRQEPLFPTRLFDGAYRDALCDQGLGRYSEQELRLEPFELFLNLGRGDPTLSPIQQKSG